LGQARARAQAESIGAAVAIARAEHTMTRKQASLRAGVSPDTQQRVESGDPGVSLTTLCAVASAVGVDVVVKGYQGRGPSLRDTGQLEIAETVIALAHSAWQPALELAAGEFGQACDIGFFGAHEILDTEIERLIADWQAQFRRAGLKREWLAARHQRPVHLVMIVEDTRRNRMALAPHADLIRTALPAASREVLAALRTGTPLGRDGLLWFRRRRPPS
jgi:transcriptional regulator with XRE-family HTH domain